MRKNLLVIDRTAESKILIQSLEREGHRCFHARGPLRVASILNAERIDLVVWNETGGDPALADDLVAVWKCNPDLPVVHLFPPGGGETGTTSRLQIRSAMPAVEAQTALPALVHRLLGATPGSASFGQKTEPAFRNVVETLRRRSGAPADGVHAVHRPRLRASVTSVNAAERAGLTESPTKDPIGLSPVRWLAKHLARTRSLTQ